MSQLKSLVATLTIANGGTDSDLLSSLLSVGQLKVLSATCKFLEITGPAALTGTCTLMTVPTEGSTTWTTAIAPNSTGAIAAVQTVQIPVGGFADLKIHSGSAEGAARTFIIYAMLDVC